MPIIQTKKEDEKKELTFTNLHEDNIESLLPTYFEATGIKLTVDDIKKEKQKKMSDMNSILKLLKDEVGENYSALENELSKLFAVYTISEIDFQNYKALTDEWIGIKQGNIKESAEEKKSELIEKMNNYSGYYRNVYLPEKAKLLLEISTVYSMLKREVDDKADVLDKLIDFVEALHLPMSEYGADAQPTKKRYVNDILTILTRVGKKTKGKDNDKNEEYLGFEGAVETASAFAYEARDKVEEGFELSNASIIAKVYVDSIIKEAIPKIILLSSTKPDFKAVKSRMDEELKKSNEHLIQHLDNDEVIWINNPQMSEDEFNKTVAVFEEERSKDKNIALVIGGGVAKKSMLDKCMELKAKYGKDFQHLMGIPETIQWMEFKFLGDTTTKTNHYAPLASELGEERQKYVNYMIKLPLMAITKNKIIIQHGGVPEKVSSLEDITNMNLPEYTSLFNQFISGDGKHVAVVGDYDSFLNTRLGNILFNSELRPEKTEAYLNKVGCKLLLNRYTNSGEYTVRIDCDKL